MTDYSELLDNGRVKQACSPGGQGIEEHLRRLEERGTITRFGERCGKLRPMVRRCGALSRFLRKRSDGT